MAKIEGVKEWADIPLLEDGERLSGGVDGKANIQAKALSNRTEYLKEELENKMPKAHTHEVVDVKGLFQGNELVLPNGARLGIE